MHYGVPNDAALVAVLVFALFAAVLAVIAERTHFFSRAVRWIQKDPVVRTALVVLLFAIGPITARTKNGQMSLPRPPLLLQVVEPPPEPATAPVSVWTNGVALRSESTTAVEITAFRKVGGTEIGDWIEVAEPFFAIGTNPVSRCYVSASGSVSFESMRRPPVGSSLPDGTGLPVLCPLRAHLGMVPEANWTSASVQSRFWHNAIPGGGRVLTWEDALLDRQSGRRVSFQVELHPTGDFIYRYDFGDALAPAATNLVIGAQAGTNAVNALAVLGTNTLSATLWRVGNTLVTNGVAIADNVELMMGMDPLDADEDGDGIPDGVLAASWTANSLWASNSADGVIVTVSLRSVIPAGAAATFVLDDLAIPLRSPASWSFAFEPGIAHNYRLFVTHGATADLSITTVPPNPVRGSEESSPLWAEGDGGVFDGPVNVWVQFPAETQMMADHAIQSHAVSLWAQTLALCTETNRHEVGCWIRLDTATGAYSFTPMVIGDPTPNDQASNINLLPLPVDSPLFPRLSSGSAVYTVASLHTHTPTTYRSGNPRIAGPSTADENASTGLSMPGLVYDYVDSSISPGMIPMGHPLHAATRLYPTAVCPRRIHP